MSKARGPYRVDPLGYKKANEALNKMADNAREIGLDYEPAQQEPVKDNTYGYAKSLAEAIFKQHFASDEHYKSGRIVWGVNDTVIGILTQIDNMVADMVRRTEQPAQQESVALETVYETIIQWDEGGGKRSRRELARRIVALYDSPQAREWVGLTDEEIHDIYDEVARREPYNMAVTRRNIARAIEAQLMEKNA